MTAADLEDAERMVSSSRRMVGAASGEFERLRQSGYRVTNPSIGVMATDRDGLKIIKELASDAGQSSLVKVMHGASKQVVERQASTLEQRKGVELDVIHLVDDKAYGYAPAGLVEASLSRVDVIREERSRKDWADFAKRVQANKDKVAKRMEALEKKYGPKMADLQDRFEDAVNAYLDEPTPQAKRDLAPVVATAKRYDRTLGGAVAVFMAELTKMPEEAGGKRRNPHNNGPDFARMAWNFVPGSALIEEELKMMDRQRRGSRNPIADFRRRYAAAGVTLPQIRYYNRHQSQYEDSYDYDFFTDHGHFTRVIEKYDTATQAKDKFFEWYLEYAIKRGAPPEGD